MLVNLLLLWKIRSLFRIMTQTQAQANLNPKTTKLIRVFIKIIELKHLDGNTNYPVLFKQGRL